MKSFRALAVAAVGLAFLQAVLGSWVRINGAGMTCPDWPLCKGVLIPTLHGGVVLEWTHRLVASIVVLTTLGVLALGIALRRQIPRIGRPLFALGCICASEVVLGGVTVMLSNSPLSVALHWGMGMALLATLAAVAVFAFAATDLRAFNPRLEVPGLVPLALITATVLAFATMCVGAYTSSSFAGLACPNVPFCDGSLFGVTASQHVQMLHRIVAFAFAVAALYALSATSASADRRVRMFTATGCALVAVQVVLGIANVVWGLPIAFREAHAANAVATFLAFTVATTFSTLAPARMADRATSRAPSVRQRFVTHV